ncbi:MAG: SAP domain-containing protein [Betaproteobacteria bacterium]|nr:SAP domain-containing protein [Betaproteobacteria bacterium]
MTTLQEARNLAKQYHIKAAGLSETELIRKIQQSEGSFDCFATATNGECDQLGCKWRTDCFAAAAN